ncbi:hypothetical protein ABIG06_001461 [Bradyrhizobium sp. USDA 326]
MLDDIDEVIRCYRDLSLSLVQSKPAILVHPGALIAPRRYGYDRKVQASIIEEQSGRLESEELRLRIWRKAILFIIHLNETSRGLLLRTKHVFICQDNTAANEKAGPTRPKTSARIDENAADAPACLYAAKPWCRPKG